MTEELALVLSRLGGQTAAAVASLAEKYPNLSEIRFRANRRLSAVVDFENVASPYMMTDADIEKTLVNLCDGSVYSHMDTMNEGYFFMPRGIRVGVCGSAVISGDVITQITDVRSLSVRLPMKVSNVSAPLYDILSRSAFHTSALIYSPPAVGKTTILRDIATKLADDANKRVAVIDERRELFADPFDIPDNIDVFVGYPKYKAFEIAARTMNPQYIICDEIGSEEEAWSMLSLQNVGVPVIATAHASSVSSLLRRGGIELLHEYGVFDLYVGIRRDIVGTRVEYTFTDRDEV